jgi:outer membrane autotransporter protein
VWGRVERSDYRRTAKEGDQPFEQKDIAQLRTGIELPFAESWALAAAAGYDDGGDLRFNAGRATGKSEGVHGGIALRKYIGDDGQGSISVGVAGGIQWVDMARQQSVFVNGVGTSKFKNDYIAFNANARYTLNSGALFAKPEVNVSYVGLGQRSFEENGLLGLGVQGLRNRDWIVTATPGLTLGVHLSDAVQFSVNGAAVLHNKSNYAAPFRLIGADDTAEPASIRSRFDKTALAAGVDLLLLREQKFSVEAGYRGEFGETTRSQNLRLKMTVAF